MPSTEKKDDYICITRSCRMAFMFISQILYIYSMCALLQTMQTMDQITIRTPTPKCRLFLKKYL